MASGTSSTATIFTLPYYSSRSCQIIEPQLNRGSIRSPDQRSFVPIYFKRSRRYHVSNVSGVTLALARSARVARVPPIAKHPAKVSNLPALPNQPFPGSRLLRRNIITFLKQCLGVPPTKRDLIRVFFLELTRSILIPFSSGINLPHEKWLKNLFEPRFECFFTKGKYSNRGSNARFTRENLFEPLFPADSARVQVFSAGWHTSEHESSTPLSRQAFQHHFQLLSSPRPFIHLLDVDHVSSSSSSSLFPPTHSYLLNLTDLRPSNLDHSDHTECHPFPLTRITTSLFSFRHIIQGLSAKEEPRKRNNPCQKIPGYWNYEKHAPRAGKAAARSGLPNSTPRAN